MNILKKKIQRRDFIRNLARAGLIVPFASSFGLMSKAHALPGGARRFVQFFYSNGCEVGKWHSYNTGALNANSFDNNNCPLLPLAPHYQNVLAIKNLSLNDGQGAATDHPTPAGNIMSGGQPGATTIEHVIGNHLGGQVSNHLYTGVRAGGITVFRDGNGNPISPESNPQTIYDSNFAGLSGGGEPDPETVLRSNILESLDENLALLQTNQLGAKENAKLETYENSLAFYRGVLEADIDASGFSRPTIGEGQDNSVDGELEALAQLDNITMAFASDFTRTAAVQFMSPNGDPILQNFPSLNDWLGEYRNGGSRGSWNENRTHAASHLAAGGGDASHVCNAQTAWYNMMVAELITKLKALPDPTYDGTIFDNTVMMIMSEHCSAGAHGNDNAGIYVVAGDNTGVNTGNAIDASGRGPADLQYQLTQLFGMGWGGFGNSRGTAGIPGFY